MHDATEDKKIDEAAQCIGSNSHIRKRKSQGHWTLMQQGRADAEWGEKGEKK